MSLFQHSTYGQNIEVTVATSNLQTCSVRAGCGKTAGHTWNEWRAHTIYQNAVVENPKTSTNEPQTYNKKGPLGNSRKSPKAPLFSELPADLVTGRGIHGVGRVEASVVWGTGMERVAMTFRNS